MMRRTNLVVILLGILVFMVPFQNTTAFPEEGQMVIVFDLSHDQPLSIDKRNFTQAIEFFQSHTEYFTRIHSEGEINATTLNRARVLVIPNPGSNYSTEELEAISDFVNQGGALFLLGDYQFDERRIGNPRALNQILQAISECRISFTSIEQGNITQGDSIVDSVNNVSVPFNVRISSAGVTSETQAAIFSGIEEVLIAGGSLLTNDSSLIVSRGANSSQAISLDGQIIQEQPPWLAAFTTGSARVVLCSSTTMFSDTMCAGLNTSWFQSGDNSILWYRIFNWMTRPLIYDPTPVLITFMAMVLLIGTGLFLYSFWRVKRSR
jgi:hypothetical protein